jgi:hypothetical protein
MEEEILDGQQGNGMTVFEKEQANKSLSWSRLLLLLLLLSADRWTF